MATVGYNLSLIYVLFIANNKLNKIFKWISVVNNKFYVPLSYLLFNYVMPCYALKFFRICPYLSFSCSKIRIHA